MQVEANSSLTQCGLPGVAQIPFGIHMCHFYKDRQDLVEALVPFFVAGLNSNERCIWVTAEPLNAADAKAELKAAGVDVDTAIQRGALSVLDSSEFYLKARGMSSTEVAALWLAEEERALEDGYSGLRITGNASFLDPKTWPDFMDYEEVVHRAFNGRRIISLCTYDVRRCEASGIAEVMRRHSCALEHPDGGWQIVSELR